MTDIQYKELDSFTSIVQQSININKDAIYNVPVQFVQDTENALRIFFSSSPNESIDQIETLIRSLHSNDLDFKAFILSYDFIPRIISLAELLIFSISEESKNYSSIFSIFEKILPVLKLFEIIISEEPEVKCPDTLKFCFELLDIYFRQNMFPEHLQFIHLLLRCFLNHISSECIQAFDKLFFDRIGQFLNRDYDIQLDISQIVQKIAQFLPQISGRYQYFFDFMEILIDFTVEDTSFPYISALKNIVEKDRHFIHAERGDTKPLWTYKAIMDFSIDHDYNTQAVTFEICGLLKDKEIVRSLLVSQRISNSIESIISDLDFNDIRVIPIIHALTNFLKLDPLNCINTYITKKGSELLSPYLVQYVVDGSFSLKIDAGYLLSEMIQKEPSIFIHGISDDLSKLFQFKIGDLKTAILNILDFDNDGFSNLIISMLTGLYLLCQECKYKCCIDDIQKIQLELASSGVFEKVEYLLNNSDDDEITSLCKNILDCFQNEGEEIK